MTFSNFVKLEPGIPVRLHFTDYYEVNREIRDKESGRLKRVDTKVFYVNEEDGETVSKTFSIMSQKLFAHFIPFLPGNDYRNHDFVITQMGDGFYSDWNVQVIRRPE